MASTLYAVSTHGAHVDKEREGKPTIRYEGLTLHWEAENRKAPPVPYAEALETPGDGYDEAYICSLFTEREARAVAEHASDRWPDSHTMFTPVFLPCGDGCTPLSAMPQDRQQGALVGEIEGLRVGAYYDIRSADRRSEIRDGVPYRTVTLTLPGDLADKIERQRDPGKYLSALQVVADKVSELKAHNATRYATDAELPF